MSYLSRYGRKNLGHSCAQFKFSIFFGPIEMPAHTSCFRVLLCFAMASNQILWFARAQARQYYGTWVLPSKLDILADSAGSVFRASIVGWRAAACLPIRVRVSTRLVCVDWTATSSPSSRAPWAIPQSGRAGVLLRWRREGLLRGGPRLQWDPCWFSGLRRHGRGGID